MKEFRILQKDFCFLHLAGARTILFVLAVLLSYSTLWAQNDFREGWVITLQNDTTQGWVKDSPAHIREGTCEFKLSESSSPQSFDPEGIKGFGFSEEDRYYHSLEIAAEKNENKKVFAEKLFSGSADLYAYDDFFYLQKDGKQEKIEKISVRETNTGTGRYLHQHKIYIGTLNRYFSDCLPAKLLKGDVAYTEKDFVDVFKKYSECSGAPYYQYKNRRQRRRISFQVFAGINNSSIKFNDKSLNIYGRDNNLFVGFGITVPMSFLGDKVFFIAEPQYYSNVYRGTRSGFTPTGAVDKDYILELSALKMPVGIKVAFGKSGVMPYVKTGLTALFPLKGEARIENDGASEGTFRIEEKTASLIYWGGFGMQFKLAVNRYLFIELRGEKFVDYIGFYGPQGATNIPSSLFNKMFIFGFNL